MISCSKPIAIARPTQLVFGTVLSLLAIGGTAQKASANPLQAIPIVGDLLNATRPAPPLPTELDVFHDNVQGNNVNLCVLSCGPIPLPGSRPTQARPPQARPVQARSPQGVPTQARPPQGIPQGAPRVQQGAPRPQGAPTNAARPGNSPKVTVTVPPINIPL